MREMNEQNSHRFLAPTHYTIEYIFAHTTARLCLSHSSDLHPNDVPDFRADPTIRNLNEKKLVQEETLMLMAV
jgi:hypothetical protein